MTIFVLSNLLFLAGFVWLQLTGAEIGLTLGGVAAWMAADYAIMWLTGYEPPEWLWGGILAISAAVWAALDLAGLDPLGSVFGG